MFTGKYNVKGKVACLVEKDMVNKFIKVLKNQHLFYLTIHLYCSLSKSVTVGLVVFWLDVQVRIPIFLFEFSL